MNDAIGSQFAPVRVRAEGVICALGSTVDQVWRRACAGESSAAIERVPIGLTEYEFALARYGKQLLADEEVTVTRRIGRTHQLAFEATAQAIGGSSSWAGTPPNRRAVVAGVGFGEIEYLEQMHRAFLENPRRVSPLAIPVVMPSSVAVHLAERYDAQGPVLTVSTACASGSDAIGVGAGLLQSGAAHAVLVVGVDSMLTPAGIWFFRQLSALTRNTTQPELASRPFDADRDGLVLGEGACAVVIEPLGPGPSLGTLIGYSANHAGGSVVAPSVTHATAVIGTALATARLNPRAITAISAHGTSTVLNDQHEAEAFRAVFGKPPPVTAIKGSTGHLIAASSLLEIVLALRTARTGIVPPVAGTALLGSDIGVDVVIGRPRTVPRGPVLSTSFGFGGQNSATIVGPDS